MTTVRVDRLDPSDARDAADLLALLDAYAAGATGGGRPLTPDVRQRLPGVLASRAHYLGLIARVGDAAVGLANCFEGVSTFRARPLLNLHDLVVAEGWRRRGVGVVLLEAVLEEARARGCCKVTLEVLSGNRSAIAAYERTGFRPYALDPAMGEARFYERWID